MKKYILPSATTLLIALATTSCGDNQTQDTSNTITAEQETTAAQELEERATRDSIARSMPKTTIEFKELSHDFGKAKEGDILSHTYEFTNTGEHPFVISNVNTPCGCTEPKYSKKPVMPGETSSIEVQFNTQNKVGKNTNRPVTIYGNIEKEIQVTFDAEVEKK